MSERHSEAMLTVTRVALLLALLIAGSVVGSFIVAACPPALRTMATIAIASFVAFAVLSVNKAL